MDLKSMALAMPEVAGHPNRAAFQGVLTMVDVPSQRPPSGAGGHLVVLTKKAAEAALPSLLGMGVDYSPSLDRHDVRCKVGVITSAEIVGRNIELGGYLFARDFPEIVEEIAKSRNSNGHRSFKSMRARKAIHSAAEESQLTSRGMGADGESIRVSLLKAATNLRNLTEALRERRQSEHSKTNTLPIRAETQPATGAGGLGMSYEVTEVQLADRRATVWMLEKVTFTGAAILRRDKAAYGDTWIELST